MAAVDMDIDMDIDLGPFEMEEAEQPVSTSVRSYLNAPC